MAINTTGQVRRALAEAMERVSKGELAQEDGKNLIGLANQISHSMAVEVKVQAMQIKAGHQSEKFGKLSVD